MEDRKSSAHAVTLGGTPAGNLPRGSTLKRFPTAMSGALPAELNRLLSERG
jgi:hypothetical protein